MFKSEIDVLQAIKSSKLKSPVTKSSKCDLRVMEGLYDGGYIKADKHLPIADGRPQFFNPEVTLRGEQRLEQLKAPIKIWNIDRWLVVLGILTTIIIALI